MKITALVLAIAGAAVLAAGLFLGLGSINRDGTSCGSGFSGVNTSAVFQADLERAMQADSTRTRVVGSVTQVQDDCTAAVSDRSTLAYVVTVPGAVLLAASVVLLVVAANRKEPAQG